MLEVPSAPFHSLTYIPISVFLVKPVCVNNPHVNVYSSAIDYAIIVNMDLLVFQNFN